MKEQLKQFCKSLNIDYVGIAPPGPYNHLAQILKQRLDKGQYTEFNNPNFEQRINPRLTMADTASIIVCLFPYFIGEQTGANLSKYTYALDYHKVIKNKLEQIGSFLCTIIRGFHYQAYVDTGPLVDRYLAYLAGLGFYGINSHIITEKYGSYVFIGYMLTNYPFSFDVPLPRTCIQCGRCIKACPGQIILGDFNIDPRLCRSYLTQKKGDLSAAEQAIISKTALIFGCDVCQDVCPHNEGIALTNIPEFHQDIVYRIAAEDLLALSNKEFMRKYGKYAFSWRGKKLLLRNLEYLRS